MSQKSITSFFKMTPKKPANVVEENLKEVRIYEIVGHRQPSITLFIFPSVAIIMTMLGNINSYSGTDLFY